ncbi:unnamed protein product [Phytomonas sp. EM1]|nr:unnamed protein product [Phytomonas sp. EM1]|eukprot:CCW62710.1 unnamed protein product [Phytomonas sp. isolate EM1]
MFSHQPEEEGALLPNFDHVRVAIRESETKESDLSSTKIKLQVQQDKLVAFVPNESAGLMYDYDYYFPQNSGQKSFCKTIGMEMVELAMHGRSTNCVILGMPGTGKNDALFGNSNQEGLIQATVRELFNRLERQSTTHEYQVLMRYWLMHRDRMMDCLSSEDTKEDSASCACCECTSDMPGTSASIFRDRFGRLYVANLKELSVKSYEDFEVLLNEAKERCTQGPEARAINWHSFIQLSITTTDKACGESCVLRQMTFVHTKGAGCVGKMGLRGNMLQEGSNINVSLLLLYVGVIHSLEYRQRRMHQVHTQEDLYKLIMRSQSFFMGCRFSQIMSQFVSGHEASFIVGCVSLLSYAETVETLENLQLFHKLECSCIPVVTISQKGHLIRDLRKLERSIGGAEVVDTLESAVASGRPLTEDEEELLRLRERLKHWGDTNFLEHNQMHFKEQYEEDLKRSSRERLTKSYPLVGAATHGDRKKMYLNAKKTATYKGQWADGLFDGFGEHIYANVKYRGEFRKGQREGMGTLFLKLVDKQSSDKTYKKVYEGEWLAGKRDGIGTEWCKDGDVYTGGFLEDRRHGEGKLYLANGDRIEGSFQHGLVEGWAVLFTVEGDWFEGYWSQGMREGPGLWHYVHRQQRLYGEWSKNISVLGTIEDDPDKQPIAADGTLRNFIPPVSLMNYDSILKKERDLLNERRSREFQSKGLTWIDYAVESSFDITM